MDLDDDLEPPLASHETELAADAPRHLGLAPHLEKAVNASMFHFRPQLAVIQTWLWMAIPL